jgi:hypothetical protein
LVKAFSFRHIDQQQTPPGLEHAFELSQHGSKIPFREQVEHEVVDQQVETAVGELQVICVAGAELVISALQQRYSSWLLNIGKCRYIE